MSAKDFINEASRQGFTLSVQDFLRFRKMAEGKDMGSIVSELREGGYIDDRKFQDLKDKATGFMNLLDLMK